MQQKTYLKQHHIATRLILTTCLLVFCNLLNAQEIIHLYSAAIPNSKSSELEESVESNGMFRIVKYPTLEYYKPNPEKASGASVIIIAGGGYSVIVYQGEGVNTAKQLSEQGVAAFVLKYRLPNDDLMLDKKFGPLQDVQQAIKLIRERADSWGLDKNKIGIMGFSAGGHLASTAATHFETSYIENQTITSLRPDFQILVYPVISMTDSLTHAGSRENLLGKWPSSADVSLFSNELQVNHNTPPAYLTHATDDKLVDVDNSILYFEKLRHENVEVEMHIYSKGDHGFIFRNPSWIDPLIEWLKIHQWML